MRKIASRYAVALFKLTSKSKDQEQYLQDLLLVRGWIKESKDFSNMLGNPLLPKDQTISVMEALAKKAKLSKKVSNLLLVLSAEGRLGALSCVIDEYQSLYNQAHDISVAQIEIAHPLTKELEAKFETALTDHFEKKLIIKHKVNPNLVGGFRAKVGSHLIDASIKTQIMKLSRMLKGA